MAVLLSTAATEVKIVHDLAVGTGIRIIITTAGSLAKGALVVGALAVGTFVEIF